VHLWQAPALPAKIGQGWKGMTGTNDLAYSSVKSFITLAPANTYWNGRHREMKIKKQIGLMLKMFVFFIIIYLRGCEGHKNERESIQRPYF